MNNSWARSPMIFKGHHGNLIFRFPYWVSWAIALKNVENIQKQMSWTPGIFLRPLGKSWDHCLLWCSAKVSCQLCVCFGPWHQVLRFCNKYTSSIFTLFMAPVKRRRQLIMVLVNPFLKLWPPSKRFSIKVSATPRGNALRGRLPVLNPTRFSAVNQFQTSWAVSMPKAVVRVGCGFVVHLWLKLFCCF